ncbi:acyl-CoA synthetase [Aquibacillus sp. 3ASR75-11]|uniref:Acyl-CoA synthetase n=1 Tax=Terrihalobacillus insolitus TaxID=2950438 RepID=A0A9X4AN79_9BACI|nr:acyl-CoA synthetase [Terrihalobacillus insolitus]MDC3415216.1 acyl-CoA synthetase [Terrihalobacillus insolitus]MDC3426232.1 acyl-CoA synthetase [Terrihalobacillus insolitus]
MDPHTMDDLGNKLQRANRNTLSDLLARTRDRMPNKFALAYNNHRVTYEQLDDVVNQTAHAFLENGIKKGDMVTVMSKNSLDFVVVNFALTRIGAVMIPINYMLKEEDVQYIIEHAEVTGFIASEEYAPVLDRAAGGYSGKITHRYLMDVDASYTVSDHLSTWETLAHIRKDQPTYFVEAELDDEDLAHVLYTSGTESRPKGVMLSHKSLVSEYVSCIIDGKMDTNDIAIHALPLYHSAQLHVFLGPSIYLGSSGIILGQANPQIILQTIEEQKATQLFCPPTVWIGLLRHPDFDKRDLSSLEKCYYGAAIMPMEILKELSERLPQAKFWNFYGQTEVAPLATALQPEDQLRKLGSAGTPSLNVQTRIVDEEDHEVPRNEIGEIVHRTPHAMKGYLHDPEKTAEAFRNGWFHSGDLGVMDEEGYITIIDRKKDMINTGGVNVSSREVEETIYQMIGVSEVAVISIPDPYWIEAVTAIIVPKDGVQLTEDEVISFCKSKLSTFKVPKYVDFTESLPKNPSGKVLKRSLRDQYQTLSEK